MPVLLDPQLEELIHKRVEQGPFQSASELIREALRLMDERERVEHLRALLAVGWEQADRGDVYDLTPELLEEITREADEMIERGEEPDPDVCP